MRAIIVSALLTGLLAFGLCGCAKNETQTQEIYMSDSVLYITANSTTFTAKLADNSSARALVGLLKKGDITVNAHDYGNFEKVGDLPQSLPTNDTQITTGAGDLILYQGNKFVFYYDENSWSFTRLGKVEGYTTKQLKSIFGDGNVDLLLSLKSSDNKAVSSTNPVNSSAESNPQSSSASTSSSSASSSASSSVSISSSSSSTSGSIKEEDPVSENIMYIKANDTTFTATLADNSSARALVELLKNGDVTVNAHDFSNFEKVGSLPQSLPRNDEQITTGAGDLILYQGNQFVFYYDTNSWSFTRLGKVEGYTTAQLKSILGDGNVDLVLSLNK